jgi:hypothetical protein
MRDGAVTSIWPAFRIAVPASNAPPESLNIPGGKFSVAPSASWSVSSPFSSTT